jgi:hypothetical protein
MRLRYLQVCMSSWIFSMPPLWCAVQCEMGFSWSHPWYAATSHQNHCATHPPPPHHREPPHTPRVGGRDPTRSDQPRATLPTGPQRASLPYLSFTRPPHSPRQGVDLHVRGERENARQGLGHDESRERGILSVTVAHLLLRLLHLLFLKADRKKLPLNIGSERVVEIIKKFVLLICRQIVRCGVGRIC